MRLLREALTGSRSALRDLVRPYEPGLWSVCAGMYERSEDQKRAWQAFQDTLDEAVSGFGVERPVGVQLFGHLWACLTLNIADAATGDVPVKAGALPNRSVAEDHERVLAALHRCAALDRAVWLFATVTGLSMASLAELTKRPEDAIRRAHSQVSWVVHSALLP